MPRLGEDLFRHYHAWREAFQCEVLPALLADPANGWIDDDLLRAALADALAELRETLGEDPQAWRWGALHRLRLATPLASIPGLEALFVAADVELGGDEQTVMQGGFDGRDGYRVAVIPSWRVVYDLADLDRSVGVLPAGVSGNPASPHWNDQAAAVGERRVPSPSLHRGRRGRGHRLPHAARPPVTSAVMPKSEGRQKQKKSGARYNLAPAKKKRSKTSPRWYGPLILIVMGAGVLVIVLNYIGLMPGSPEQPVALGRPRPDRRRFRGHHLLVLITTV